LRKDGFSCLIARVGGRFWLGLFAAVIGIGIAAFLVFVFIEAAFLRWGAIGALIFFAALALIVSWFYDRRVQARWDEGESEA
jgi:membrane protein implicated in regulation of membrane protease activity